MLARSKEIREIVERAVVEKKLFTIYGGPEAFSDVREALLERGWIERPPPREGDVVSARRNIAGCKVLKPKKRKTEAGAHDASERPGTHVVSPDTGCGGGGSGSDHDDTGDDDTDDDDTDDDDVDDQADPAKALERSRALIAERFAGGTYSDEVELVNLVLSEYPPNFIWSPKRGRDVDMQTLLDSQHLNGFGKTSCLTTKAGLTKSLRNLTVFESADPDTIYPRCFNLSLETDRQGFFDTFIRIAAQSVLKKMDEWAPPHEIVQIALAVVDTFLAERGHDDIDLPIDAVPPYTTVEWQALLQYTYFKNDDGTDKVPIPEVPPARRNLATRLGPTSPGADCCVGGSGGSESLTSPTPWTRSASLPIPSSVSSAAELSRASVTSHLSETDSESANLFDHAFHRGAQAGKTLLESIMAANASGSGGGGGAMAGLGERIAAALAELKERNVQDYIEGARNVWVVKPAAKSRGRGIFCENRLDLILETISNADVKEKYVAQKYIERPLTIKATKFDIRQYFVVTSWNPLNVYFYKDSYVRFSSVAYDLSDLRSEEAKYRHLCNNSIQHDAATFDQDGWNEGCMWTSDQFRDYLSKEGSPDVWDSIIYPQMKEIIAQTCKCCQETVLQRKNSFELYGADFILDESFKPWIIEVNSSPSMDKGTPATEQLVSSTLQDVVKLTMDRKQSRRAEIGQFELVLRQAALKSNLHAESMPVEGVEIRAPRKPNCGAFARVPKAPHRLSRRQSAVASDQQPCQCNSMHCLHPSHRDKNWKPQRIAAACKPVPSPPSQSASEVKTQFSPPTVTLCAPSSEPTRFGRADQPPLSTEPPLQVVQVPQQDGVLNVTKPVQRLIPSSGKPHVADLHHRVERHHLDRYQVERFKRQPKTAAPPRVHPSGLLVQVDQYPYDMHAQYSHSSVGKKKICSPTVVGGSRARERPARLGNHHATESENFGFLVGRGSRGPTARPYSARAIIEVPTSFAGPTDSVELPSPSTKFRRPVNTHANHPAITNAHATRIGHTTHTTHATHANRFSRADLALALKSRIKEARSVSNGRGGWTRTSPPHPQRPTALKTSTFDPELLTPR
jgi:tubulin monoglycylase TTLL3/8